MQEQYSVVYKTSKDAVLSIVSMNNRGEAFKKFSGWVQEVKDQRIFVITCAHNLLVNATTLPAYPYFAATIENANNKSNIAVSLRLLGFDISADIAVLYSIKPSEQTIKEPLGFKFSSSQASLDFNQSKAAQNVSLIPGTPVYCISNIYANGLVMTTGFMQDDDVIYNTASAQYTNYTDQLISTLTVSDGSSGAPVLVYDNGAGSVVGMVAFTKKVDNFTGGPNVKTLQYVYKKLIKLNKDFKQINFNGKTGKGYIGITNYNIVDEYVLTMLTQKYKAFNESKYRNEANGVILLALNNKDMIIPNSRVQNAIPYYKEGKKYKYKNIKKGIKPFDIVLEVNGAKVGIFDDNGSLNNEEYFKAGKKIILKVLRPETAEIIYFKVLCDQYPANLEKVSIDDSIRLVGFFDTLKGGIGLIIDYFIPGPDMSPDVPTQQQRDARARREAADREAAERFRREFDADMGRI